MPSTAGRLLVAEPMLGDPNFDRTVVLVISHSEEGALGLVLNRPSETPVPAVLPAWEHLVTDPPVVHVGGPVEGQSGWCLARVRDPSSMEGFVPVVGDLGLLDLEHDPALLADQVVKLRLYAGYSGWGAGQLDFELGVESWIVVDADVDDPFTVDGAALWSRILARQGGTLARLSTFPPDPSLN
jgi:putative transcriptional regulator